MRRSQKILTLLRIQFESANQKKKIFDRYQSYRRRNLKKPRVALGTRMIPGRVLGNFPVGVCRWDSETLTLNQATFSFICNPRLDVKNPYSRQAIFQLSNRNITT